MNALEPRDVNLTELVVLLVLGLGLLDLFFDVLPGVPFFLVFIVGFAVVVPLVHVLFGGEEDETASRPAADTEPEEDPLAELRRRYAEGEIDEVEFERRLERLLETEDEAAASEYAERLRSESETDRDAGRESA